MVTDAEGNPQFVVGVVEEITARKKMEAALKESEELLRLAIESADIGTFDFHPATGELIWSEHTKRHFGLPADARVDFSIFLSGLHPADRERVERTVENMLRPESGGEYSNEYRTIGIDDGRERWIAARGRVYYAENGQAVRLTGTTLDITELKRTDDALRLAAAELENANQELEAFNYTVAHDLRKPLTVVNSYCQVIKELCGNQLDEQCQGYLEETYKGTMRMNRLIDALLNFSRLTQVELHREAVDLGAMATVVTSELKFAEPGRRVTFLLTDGICVEGDANLLRLVLENLIGNSWKYTGRCEEAIIEFGAMVIDSRQTCFVRDNGAGFDMADKDKLFTPFKRLTGAEEFRGYGIGLATVERIIRRHGGRVWAESEPGKGATFYFTLPESGIST